MTVAVEIRPDGTKILVIVLEPRNLEAMRAGHPAWIREAVHGDAVPKGWEVLVALEEKPGDHLAQALAEGRITPETRLSIDARVLQGIERGA